MKRTLAVAVSIAAALVAIVGAQAKAPPDGIDLCGASGCNHVGGQDAERLYINTYWQNPSRPATPAPFFVLNLRWSTTRTETVYWVPAGGVLRRGAGYSTWSRPDATARAILDQATAGLEPFRFTLRRVFVGGRVVRAPQTYLRLFRGRWLYDSQPSRWLRVRFTTVVLSPWSDGDEDILLDRKGPYLYLDGYALKIAATTAQRARLRLPLK